MKPVRMLLAAALLCAGHAFAHGGRADMNDVGVIGVALFRRKQTPPPAPISEAEKPLRGIIREPLPVAPRPFPGFVPDPQG
jgi:hypothetical protein